MIARRDFNECVLQPFLVWIILTQAVLLFEVKVDFILIDSIVTESHEGFSPL